MPTASAAITQRGPIDDAMRARAQAFTAGGSALFLAICDDPPSLLLAASADSGMHAGDLLKAALASQEAAAAAIQLLRKAAFLDPALERALNVVTRALVLLR